MNSCNPNQNVSSDNDFELDLYLAKACCGQVSVDQFRTEPPPTAERLWAWIAAFTGVRVAHTPVCLNHCAPFDWLSNAWLNRQSQALVLGPRGGGKSFLTAILTHMESRFKPQLGTRILGGSKSQSMQIYEAITAAVRDGRGNGGSDAGVLSEILKDEARYTNGSHVAILAASATSVRGPHVASLRLDEVDEIDPDLREASYGMAMARYGVSASVTMTSTWHRLGGPMADLIDRGQGGEFPVYSWCAFEVLENCPESRSGRWIGGEAGYEHCPACPLKPWCHSQRDRNGDVPLAKLSYGHYAIDSLIQKVQGISRRAFESDYLCLGPKADGLWFKDFDATKNVSLAAEYDPALSVHLAIDSGVFTGAVAFQVRSLSRGRPLVNVFMDYLAEGATAEANARKILEALGNRNGVYRKASTDPAGGARNPVGPTVLAEYERAGLHGLIRWPIGPPADSLALVESLVASADGATSLLIHPRCRKLTAALQSYRRARRGGQWQDYPEDPQHPHEDLVDALRGGLKVEFPNGFTSAPPMRRVHVGRVF